MPITHTNRKGRVYYLHKGVTRKGNPRYFFSPNGVGTLAESIPEGYEIHENPNGQVYLRREQPRLVSQTEIAMVERAVRELAQIDYAIVDAEGGSIVIHLPSQSRDSFDDLVEALGPFGLLGRSRVEAALEQRRREGPYIPLMRFTLVDESQRTFTACRWCFKGGIEDWFPLMGGRGNLKDLVDRYCPHLEKESFFDLM